MLSQRKKTNRRTKNSEEKTVRRAEKQQRRAKVSGTCPSVSIHARGGSELTMADHVDEGFHDAGETKYECEEGGGKLFEASLLTYISYI